MPGPLSCTLERAEPAGKTLAFERKFHLAAAGVAKGIARNLGHGSGDACLVLTVETQQCGDLPGALARDDDVLLEMDGDCQKRFAHGLPATLPRLRMTTTLASSRPRS